MYYMRNEDLRAQKKVCACAGVAILLMATLDFKDLLWDRLYPPKLQFNLAYEGMKIHFYLLPLNTILAFVFLFYGTIYSETVSVFNPPPGVNPFARKRPPPTPATPTPFAKKMD
eukprot:GEZU01003118.1.p1 GENE.GEZU01003118.1~~GEZU01003118.1.p1  ORF type:complete len:114 (-),score=29.95 GEZU01003118.1:27-368(-)